MTEQVLGIDLAELRLASGQHQQQRLNEDLLHYRKRTFDCNLALLKLRSERKRYGERSQRQERLSLRCNVLLGSVEKQLVSNNL